MRVGGVVRMSTRGGATGAGAAESTRRRRYGTRIAKGGVEAPGAAAAASETAARGQPVRKDDTPEVFKSRFEAYKKQTAPLSSYYASLGHLQTIDGMKPIDEVTRDLTAILDRYRQTVAS